MVFRFPLSQLSSRGQRLGPAYHRLRHSYGSNHTIPSFTHRAFRTTGVTHGSEPTDSDFFELSTKLDIADFESGKFIEETENETNFDYMTDNDDHYFGKWDPRPTSSGENDVCADGINIQIPSPKRTSTKAAIGAILQESLHAGEIPHVPNAEANEFRIDKTFEENAAFVKENTAGSPSDNYMPDEAIHGDESLENDENPTEELLAAADDLLHTTELEIEECEANVRHEKPLGNSWLEDNIMGTEAPKAPGDPRRVVEKLPRGIIDEKNRLWHQSDGFPWNTDDFSSSAGRGKQRRM